jgi:hypothetical protein
VPKLASRLISTLGDLTGIISDGSSQASIGDVPDEQDRQIDGYQGFVRLNGLNEGNVKRERAKLQGYKSYIVAEG